MSDWQVIAHMVSLPVTPDIPISVPSGWEPIATLSRQGNQAVLLCRRGSNAIVDVPSVKPVLTSLTPTSLHAGSAPSLVDAYGSGFSSSCVVYSGTSPRSTYLIDPTHVQYMARPDLASPGPVQITVQGSSGVSNALPFTFT
jgi:hypothetical protein